MRNMEEGRGIPRRAKIIALTMLWASLAFSAIKLDSIPVTTLLFTIGLAVTIYLIKFLPRIGREERELDGHP